MSQNALLQCQAVADPPNMTYVWQKGGENVYHIEWVWSFLFVPERASPFSPFDVLCSAFEQVENNSTFVTSIFLGRGCYS